MAGMKSGDHSHSWPWWQRRPKSRAVPDYCFRIFATCISPHL